MCWSEKCCFCVRLDLACIMIGGFTMVVSLMMGTASGIFLSAEMEADCLENHEQLFHILGLVHLDVNHTSRKVIFGTVVLISMLWMVSSVMLVVGVNVKISGFVLSYFAFGVFISLLAVLTSLLLLLQAVWPVSFILLAATGIYVHFLVVVHTFYELQARGKVFELSTECDESLLTSMPDQVA